MSQRTIRMRMEFDFTFTPDYYPEEIQKDPAACLKFDLENDAQMVFETAITLDDDSIQVVEDTND